MATRTLPLVPSNRPEPSGPPGEGRFGHLATFRRDPLSAILQGFCDYGDVCRFRFGPMKAFLLARPEHIQHVLLDRADNYDKKIPSYRLLKGLLGEGLLTSEGDFWRRQRRIAQPAFQRGRLVSFVPVMTRATEAAAERWAAAAGSPVELHREMLGLTLEIVGRCLVGTDVRATASDVEPALRTNLRDYHDRLFSPFALPEWFPTPNNLRLWRARRVLDRLVHGVIDARRENPEGHDDLLTRLMSARDEETGAAMSDRQLRDEVMTILMAGHETTANGLTFTFYLLARHPEVAQRLRAELDEVLGGRVPGADDLARLPYTRQVVEESMRLYPPAWALDRRAVAGDVIGGYRIPRGSVVMLSPFVTHRHPDLWEDPQRFDPDRFAPENVRGRHRFAYFPFGGGERVCIGATFALIEMRLVLAVLARRFAFEPEPDPPLELEASVTLRPRHGLRLRVRELG